MGVDAEQGFGEGALARAGLTDQTERFAFAHSQVDGYEGRNVLASLMEGLGDAVQLEDGFRRRCHLDRCRIVVAQLVETIDVVTPHPVAGRLHRPLRHLGSALVVGELAPVDVDAGREVGPDAGEVARNR